MKILVVTQYFWPENFRINDLVEDLLARGHEVTVLTGQPNYPTGKFFNGYGWFGPWQETYKNACVLRVPIVSRGQRQPLRLVLNYFSYAFIASLAVLFRLPRAQSYDRIFVFEISPITVGIPAIVARWKYKAPLLFWVLDVWPETLSAIGAVKSGRVLRMVGALVRFIYHRCDRILVASRAYIGEVIRYGGSEADIRYFPNWGEPMFDQPQLPPPTPPTNFPVGKRFLYAGNIGDAQDFPALLDAAEQLKGRADVQWILVGDGRALPWVQAEVTKRGLAHCFTFTGQQPLDAMPGFFAAADVLFLALKANPVFEKTIPGKLQSYLASGKPVLAMLDGEGARVLVESGAGMVVPAGDSTALKQAIENFVALPEDKLHEMRHNARRYYEQHFAREHVLSQLEGWLNDVVKKEPL